ncbi:MAG: hypothetical protein ACJ8F7_21540 [Gemmataceae bacterium]
MAEPLSRHPLGLPAGSVRATLALIISGLFWTLLLIPDDKAVPIPLFLYFLSAMILLFFFAHGKTISGEEGQKPPWGLPSGSFRILILLGTGVAVGLHYYLYGHWPLQRLKPQPDQLSQWPTLLIALLAGLGLGWLFGRGPWRRSAVFQDLQAWVSLLAMLGLGAEIIIVLFINPSLKADVKLDLTTWECVLTGIVAFYFGARS